MKNKVLTARKPTYLDVMLHRMKVNNSGVTGIEPIRRRRMERPKSTYKVGDRVYLKDQELSDIVQEVDAYYSYTLEKGIINIYLTDNHSADVYWLEEDLIPLEEFREKRFKRLLDE